MNVLIDTLARIGLLHRDLADHLLRAAMVLIFASFGYQKWFAYEAQVLIPYISHGPLIFWLYPLFGVRGASILLGISEWTFGAMLLAGFWNKKIGVLGALGSVATFVGTVTIIPFMPDGWATSAGGFPAMAGNVPFLMKDVVLLAVSIYLLKQDVSRVVEARLGAGNENRVLKPARNEALARRDKPSRIFGAPQFAPEAGFPRKGGSPATCIVSGWKIDGPAAGAGCCTRYDQANESCHAPKLPPPRRRPGRRDLVLWRLGDRTEHGGPDPG